MYTSARAASRVIARAARSGRVAGVKVWRIAPCGVVERISISRPAGVSPAMICR